MTRLPAALHNAPLRRLLASQIPADFADWLDFVAIGALLAFSWNAEPLAFAYVAAAVGLPYVIFGAIAGALVDRANIRTVLIASNIGRAIATACLFLATDLPTLMLIVAARSSVDAFIPRPNRRPSSRLPRRMNARRPTAYRTVSIRLPKSWPPPWGVCCWHFWPPARFF